VILSKDVPLEKASYGELTPSVTRLSLIPPGLLHSSPRHPGTRHISLLPTHNPAIDITLMTDFTPSTWKDPVALSEKIQNTVKPQFHKMRENPYGDPNWICAAHAFHNSPEASTSACRADESENHLRSEGSPEAMRTVLEFLAQCTQDSEVAKRLFEGVSLDEITASGIYRVIAKAPPLSNWPTTYGPVRGDTSSATAGMEPIFQRQPSTLRNDFAQHSTALMVQKAKDYLKTPGESTCPGDVQLRRALATLDDGPSLTRDLLDKTIHGLYATIKEAS
jgi:hypothetical protein